MISKEQEENKWFVTELKFNKKSLFSEDNEYDCKITFMNRQSESFRINLSEEKMKKYLSFVMEDINDTFSSIQKSFMDSLNDTING